MEWMPAMFASEFSPGATLRAAVPPPGLLLGWFPTIFQAVRVPAAKPKIRIAEASAGEKRIWRNHSAGSTIHLRQRACSVVSSASLKRMRDDARKFGETSSCGRDDIS